MKRVQMYIEPELDQVLAAEATRRKVSKASLIREAAREKFFSAKHEPDPLDDLVGDCTEGGALAPGDIDRIVYKLDRDSGGNLLPPEER
ncbi:MAG: CopG family transcriptional regulator [Solirubrobacterales bacterium]